MDLRGIDELRTDAMAEAVAALDGEAVDGASWRHGLSHHAASGSAATLVAQEPAGIRVRIRFGEDAAEAEAEEAAEGLPSVPTRLLSATVLKLRRGGHGVIRLEPDTEAAPGWDGEGWLQRLTATGRV